MAAIWTVVIDILDLPTKKIRVTGTRTNGVDVRSFSVEGKYDNVNQTPQQLLTSYTNWIWGEYQADVARRAAVAALVIQAQTALANALTAKEV